MPDKTITDHRVHKYKEHRSRLTPYSPLSTGTEYGLGLERRWWAGSEVWGHPGSTGGCRTSTWIDATRGVAVTTAATVHLGSPGPGDDIRYPRAQLFSMA